MTADEISLMTHVQLLARHRKRFIHVKVQSLMKTFEKAISSVI